MTKIRSTTIFFACIGFTVLVWLLVNEGIGTVFTILSLVGFNVLWVCAYRIIPICIDAYGWRHLFLSGIRPFFADLTLARWLAESVNTLLPVGQVGGHVLRARIIDKKSGIGREAGATVMVDFTLGLMTQIIFTLLGLVLLLQQTQEQISTRSMLFGISVACIMVGGFFFSQRAGLLGFMARKFNLLFQRNKPGTFVDDASNMDLKITEIYGRHGKIISCFLWRLVGWIAKSGENWLFFYFIGLPITIQEAIVLESISTAFRSAAFFVPGGIGAQDGGLLFVGSLLSLDPGNVLALALGKRFRELTVGIPGLFYWFRFERRTHPLGSKK